jgi:hypothetical protein
MSFCPTCGAKMGDIGKFCANCGSPLQEQASRTDKVLAEYELAQETAHHSDVIIHEVAAIVWGANTLLLGFILEMPVDSDKRTLVIAAAVIGIFLTAFVPYVQYLTKKGQVIAYRICREIEAQEALPHRLNTQIHDSYPLKAGQKAIWVISAVFALSWLWVICSTLHKA